MAISSRTFIHTLATLMCALCLPALAYDPMAPPGFERGEIDSVTASKTSPTKTKDRASDFVLRQIVIHDSSKSAVINGYIVSEGSYIKGARVQRINSNSVELMVLGK
ncbi:MAG: hypothetical protein RPR40_08350, partial [Bermanella sp.]